MALKNSRSQDFLHVYYKKRDRLIVEHGRMYIAVHIFKEVLYFFLLSHIW